MVIGMIILKRIIESLKLFKPNKAKARPLEAIQVGISPTCNLKCTFCPTVYMPDTDQSQMPLELFNRLVPYFPMAYWVYLQGWGEPLLNKHIWKMADMVKGAGTKVGLTTNGTLLNENAIEKVIYHNIDLISISIVNDTPEIHNKLRKGSEFNSIIDNVRKLVALKQKTNSTLSNTPKISLSYMLTTESIKNLPSMVKLACELGVDDLYAANLDYVFNNEADVSKVFSWDEKPNQEYTTLLSQTKDYAIANNFSFRYCNMTLKEQEPVCKLDPNKFVFITSTGEVTPCTYLGRKINPRIYKGKRYEIPQKSFGNIKDKTFQEIWDKKEYVEFRECFSNRNNEYTMLVEEFMYAEQSLPKIKEFERKYENAMIKYSLPKECQSCVKIYGI